MKINQLKKRKVSSLPVVRNIFAAKHVLFPKQEGHQEEEGKKYDDNGGTDGGKKNMIATPDARIRETRCTHSHYTCHITHYTLSSEMQRSQTGAELQAATNALSKGGEGVFSSSRR